MADWAFLELPWERVVCSSIFVCWIAASFGSSEEAIISLGSYSYEVLEYWAITYDVQYNKTSEFEQYLPSNTVLVHHTLLSCLTSLAQQNGGMTTRGA